MRKGLVLLVRHLRRRRGILRLVGLSQNVDSWFRTLHRRHRAVFFQYAFAVFLVVMLSLALIIVGVFLKQKVTDFFVGVEIGYDNVDDIVRFVDEVGGYVNLVVISSLNVTTNATRLTAVCDYLYNKGLYFIPFMFITEYLEKADFFQLAKERWGEHFLGVYVSEEPGGRQFDMPEHRFVNEAENYSDAASKYVWSLNGGLQQFFNHFVQPANVTTFTADYALYWFDYKAGYDVIFAEFGWNFSRQLQIALCRGAARTHNKDWGAIVAWTYRKPPYIEDSDQLYRDLVLAYNNGAKYTIVFNYPTNVTEFGVLTRKHLNSIRNFWTYVSAFPQPKQASKMAYVLPEDYGYGFRGPDDQIWGLWGPDKLSPKVWDDANSLLTSFGARLDLIYQTIEPSESQQYEKLIFWNGTTIPR